jgi:hypothetical protein
MTKVVVATHNTSAMPEFAGSIWVRLQYVLGLDRLGVESFWVDRLMEIDPRAHPHSLAYLMRRFGATAEEFGLRGRYCVVYEAGPRHFGMSSDELEDLAASADLLINIGGHLPGSSPLREIPRRAYVDVDPGFTQIWGHQWDIGLDRHNFFFTLGQNVSRPEFGIPTQGIPWEPILPPVVLDLWPPLPQDSLTRFSTVADWRGSQDAIYEGEYYGGKRREFVEYLRAPLLAGKRIDLALFIDQSDHEDLGLLHGHDWRVRDAATYAGDPWSYQEFIQSSRAEFSVAKSGYVKTNSGWVSDRTACYLASGKPALVQSTGFEWRLPTGEGLLTFRGLDEAVSGIHEINEHYETHSRAARRLAEEHLDSAKVLGSLLERVGL